MTTTNFWENSRTFQLPALKKQSIEQWFNSNQLAVLRSWRQNLQGEWPQCHFIGCGSWTLKIKWLFGREPVRLEKESVFGGTGRVWLRRISVTSSKVETTECGIRAVGADFWAVGKAGSQVPQSVNKFQDKLETKGKLWCRLTFPAWFLTSVSHHPRYCCLIFRWMLILLLKQNCKQGEAWKREKGTCFYT